MKKPASYWKSIYTAIPASRAFNTVEKPPRIIFETLSVSLLTGKSISPERQVKKSPETIVLFFWGLISIELYFNTLSPENFGKTRAVFLCNCKRDSYNKKDGNNGNTKESTSVQIHERRWR